MARSILIRISLATWFWIAVSAPVGSCFAQAATDSLDGGEPSVLPEDYEWRSTADNSPRDAGQREAATKSREDPCAAQEKQIQERKGWLAKRYSDQATRGVPNPYIGVPNLTGVYCEQHPEDEQCRLGPPPTSFEPDELSVEKLKTPEDRDPYVIGLKRELERCRRKFGH